MSWKKHAGKYVFSFLKPKPKPTKGESTKVWGQKLRGKLKKASTYEGVEKVLTSTNRLLQKVKGEKVTKSGFSKGKDLKK